MAHNDSALQQRRDAAWAKFARLGHAKVRAMSRNDYYDEDLDADDVTFAIEWLINDPEAIAAVYAKCDKLGYERVQAMVDGFSHDDELYEDEEAAACRWLLQRRRNGNDPDEASESEVDAETDTAESEETKPESDTATAAECGALESEIDAAARVAAGGIFKKLERFVGYLPAHTYIYIPTREPWPGSSVNSQIPPLKLFKPDGTGGQTPLLNDKGKQIVMAANVWLDRYRPVQQMTWAPGLEFIIKNRLVAEGGWFEQQGATCFNLYKPPTITPGDANDVKPWLDHVYKIYPNDAVHIINCLAHRIQYPQDKINHGIVLGGLQGIGKDTMLEPVKRGVGPWNFEEVSPIALVGRFNGFLKAVILRVNEAHDLGDVNRFQLYEHLKPFLAAPPDVLPVDEKNLREHKVLNVCFIIITTNHKTDGIYLPADDRRHYVAWSDLKKEDFSEEYWNTLWGWYDSGGDRNVVAFLKARDITAFNAKAPPPKTEAFWAIVNSSRAPEEGELKDILDNLGNPAAVTIGMLTNAAAETVGDESEFHRWIIDRKNRRAIPHRLEQCGYVPVRNTGALDDGGLWKAGGKRCAIYAKSELSIVDQIRAVHLVQAVLDDDAKREKNAYENFSEKARPRSPNGKPSRP